MGFDALSRAGTTVFTNMYNQGLVSANLFSFYIKRLFLIFQAFKSLSFFRVTFLCVSVALETSYRNFFCLFISKETYQARMAACSYLAAYLTRTTQAPYTTRPYRRKPIGNFS